MRKDDYNYSLGFWKPHVPLHSYTVVQAYSLKTLLNSMVLPFYNSNNWLQHFALTLQNLITGKDNHKVD